jgi:RNAse (barnase) inhibitor barstar
MKQYILDGNSFKDLNGFFLVFGEMINGEGGYFGKSMESFDDCLFGGYGMENPCAIIWKYSSLSKVYLGHEALFNWCQEQIDKKRYIDEEGFNFLMSQREQAKNTLGPTLFDQIADYIKSADRRSLGKTKIDLILE